MDGKWVKARRHNGAEVDRLQPAFAVLVKPIFVAGNGGKMEDFSELNLLARSPAFLNAPSLIKMFAKYDAQTVKELVAPDQLQIQPMRRTF